MTEGMWGDETRSPEVDWHMSAALQDVPRGGSDLAEVTSLEQAVRAWLALDPQYRGKARLTPERPVFLDGRAHEEFRADGIEALSRLLPAGLGQRP